MSNALVLESQQLAIELHSILQALDPARSWRLARSAATSSSLANQWSEIEPAIRVRLERISARLKELVEETEFPDADLAIACLRDRLLALRAAIDEGMPKPGLPPQWQELRKSLVPAYEAMAASLKLHAVHVPAMRPTNYARNAFHVAAGIGVMMLLHHTFALDILIWIAGIMTALVWTLEFTRRFSEGWNGLLMMPFKWVSHPHERYRVNSATWYTTALFVLTLFVTPLTGSLAVMVLAFSDPIAAIIGRRYGRTQILAGRTLEGTSAFLLSGMLACFAVMALYSPDLDLRSALLLALGATACGAVAELLSKRIDDNFTVPVAVGIGATVIASLIGI